MGIKHKLVTTIIRVFALPRIKRMIDKQRSLKKIPESLQPTSNSPERFDIPLEMVKLFQERKDIEMRHVFPVRRVLSAMKNIHRSVDSIQQNPLRPKISAAREFWTQFKQYAFDQGVDQFGFTKLERNLIFQRFGVLYDNVIILAMEMSKEKLDQAPSQTTLNMVFETYDDLGKAANKIAEYLRENGYAAQADHPLGGLVLFPPLAQKAGIGWIGKHGLLITQNYGPRVRLAAVYTSIENLPSTGTNIHSWISEYCAICGICTKKCPPKAIMEGSIKHESGRVTNIFRDPCFEYFAQYYGCSICVKVCPFSEGPDMYEKLKQHVINES